jgi:hypothetical protein
VGDDEWIEIRRFDDPLEAEMVRNFLGDHGIRVSVRGNAGATAVLNRFSTVVDIRLDVPRDQVDEAREALDAMEIGDAVDQPFRGLAPAESSDATRYVQPRRAATAMMLGLVVPIGAAQFYAHHGAAGGILLAGVIGAGLGISLGRPELAVAWAILVLADLAAAPGAVRRCNEGRIPSDRTQRLAALAVVVVAFGAAFALTPG